MALIVFDTGRDAYETALAQLKAVYGIAKLDKQTAEETGSDQSNQDFWSFETLIAWTQRLTDTAAEAVRYAAAHAPAVPMDEVIGHMGNYLGEENFTGQQMGGRMASLGFASKAVGATESPLQTDYWERVYRMDPDVASALREIMGPPSEDS